MNLILLAARRRRCVFWLAYGEKTDSDQWREEKTICGLIGYIERRQNSYFWRGEKTENLVAGVQDMSLNFTGGQEVLIGGHGKTFSTDIQKEET